MDRGKRLEENNDGNRENFVYYQTRCGCGKSYRRDLCSLRGGGHTDCGGEDDAVVRVAGDGFYAVHKARPFFKDLVKFMTSGPVMVQVLEGENVIARNRELMGATNPQEAADGTIRKDFASSIDENAVHGSDASETAQTEIAFFFDEAEICKRTFE